MAPMCKTRCSFLADTTYLVSRVGLVGISGVQVPQHFLTRLPLVLPIDWWVDHWLVGHWLVGHWIGVTIGVHQYVFLAKRLRSAGARYGYSTSWQKYSSLPGPLSQSLTRLTTPPISFGFHSCSCDTIRDITRLDRSLHRPPCWTLSPHVSP